LKREDAETKSPLYSQFYETITGVEVIRGYRIESKLIDEHHKLLDAHLCAKLNWDAVNRWLGINLDIIGVLMIFGAVLCLSFSRNISGSLAGLLISHAMRITNNLKSVVRTSTVFYFTTCLYSVLAFHLPWSRGWRTGSLQSSGYSS
jgi:ABC-type multidrug transport system fused ATPase/permease subunit